MRARSLFQFVRGLVGFPDLNDSRAVGRWGERLAARHLRRKGYRVLGRNILAGGGEADLVCQAPDRATFVIVEVKVRVRRAQAPELSNTVAPEAAITAHKRGNLVGVAEALARANRWDRRHVRIDVVAVELEEHRPPIIRHSPGAVHA